MVDGATDSYLFVYNVSKHIQRFAIKMILPTILIVKLLKNGQTVLY